jgi:hypothetical protein
MCYLKLEYFKKIKKEIRKYFKAPVSWFEVEEGTMSRNLGILTRRS